MGHKRHKFRGSFENQAPGLTGPGITEPDYPAHMPDMMNGKPVIISLDHPENNPPGVTIEKFTEEVPRDSFGINVGQQMEDLLKEHEQNNTTPNNQHEESKMEDTNKATVNNETKNQETKMNNESNNTNKETKQEESKMNEETKVNTEAQNNATPNQEQPKVDPKVETKDNTKQDAPKEEPKKDTPKEETKEDHPDPNKPAERDRHGSTLAREAGSAFTIGASYGMGVIVGMAAGAAIVYGVKKIFCGDGGAAAETASDTVSNLF